MTRNILYILFLLLAGTTSLFAQTPDTIRYVKASGTYTNNGRSWANAKSDLQGAINDLYEYLQENHLTSGSIYVAAGTYKPTETTEAEGGGLQFTAFKIYPGIHVYGGFRADETDDNARPYNADGSVNVTYRPLVDTLASLESGQEAKLQPWNFKHQTVLSGTHLTEPTFTYDQERGTFSTLFTGNSYHVVWFATSGFIPTDDPMEAKHALPLSAPASVDGCRITGGYAASKTTTERVHTAYGAGAYLVENATLSRCIIDKCEATMRGGGVYLDGGGLVDRCFIHTCQASGVGIMQGYGGGVCIDYDGAVTRSYIVNNSSRIGGGVSICHAPNDYPWEKLDSIRLANGGTARGEINVYSPHATACIITNNTTTAEGGGIYFYDGGVGNHLTIARNRCVGQDITYYGRRHGRSGGAYILNGGQIYNSVLWGNKCEANNDIQFATYTGGSTEDTVNPETGDVTHDGLTPKFYFSAVEKHDITDWAGTGKRNVLSLESQNTNPGGIDANYPYFIGSDGKGKMMGYAGAGLNITLPMGTVDPAYDATDPTSVPDPAKTGIPRPIYWKPAAISSMAKKGLQVTDALHLTSDWIRHAHTGTDLFNDIYEPMSTFGALVRRDEQFGVALGVVPNQEKQIYRDNGYTQNDGDGNVVATYNDEVGDNSFLPTQLPDDGTEDYLPTIFVDPSRNAGAIGIQIGASGIGTSWDTPVGNINDAIHYFREHLKRSNDGGTTFVYDGKSPVWYDSNGDCWYHIPTAFDGAGNPTAYQDYKHVQILVKAFERGSTITASTAGKDAYLGTELRTSAIRPTSNMRIYGGYYPTSTGTDTENRNARSYYSIISGNITNSGYENNSAHIVALINVKNVIIDGIKLVEGNANLNENHSYAPIDPVTGQREHITYGGGIIVNNASVPAEERIDMTGNILRNARIANCSAPDGAAVYVNSSNKNANGDYCAAELSIINTIIRNNTVGDGTHNVLQPGYGDAGIITARGGLSKIRLDHCDIVNNCGYAMETLPYIDKPSSTDPADEGQIRIYNSVIYANGRIDRDNRKNIQQPLSYRSATGSANNITGNYVFLDWDAPYPASAPNYFATLCRDMSEQYQKWAVRKVGADQLTIIEEGVSPRYFDTEEAANAFITAQGGSNWSAPVLLDYPFFENPSKNVGHSTEGDKPMNGGVISYMPQNKNPMVNAAVNSSRDLWDSDGYKRDYGGDPDIGAIEDRTLPKAGTVLYVTPNGAGRRDGSSWGNAIQGNAIYALAGGAAGSDALDAQNGARITNDDPAIGTLPGNGVPTTDNRYSGFATAFFTSYKVGGEATTTTTTTITTETNEYYRDGVLQSTETIQDHVPTTSSTSVTSGTTSDVTNQQLADPRFPYGEMSGQSRTFWRANPYTPGTYDLASFINACNTNGWISNDRTENYVSGLQYAVETAAAYNAPGSTVPHEEGVDSIQVWVGNGKYTDYKGFIMRNKTTVKGGFPVDAYGTPGEDERQALMSAVVNIPKAKRAEAFVPEDYETILQISDTNPEGEGHSFNEAAVKAWDDDLTLVMPNSTTLTTKTINRTIVHRYDWTTDAYNDVTNTYYLSSTFADNQITSETPNEPNVKVDGTQHLYEYMQLDCLHTLTFGTATDTKDCWHLTYTGASSKNNNEGVIGRNENNQMTGRDNNGKNIYENGRIVGTTTSNRLWLKNGSLSGVELWQNMKNVPAGDYKIVVDLTAYYRNNMTVNAGNVPTGVTFIVTNAEGTRVIEEPINAKNKKGTNLSQNLARAELSRYTFEFNQPSDGTLGIKITVGDLNSSYGNNREVSMENFKLYKKFEGYTLSTTSDTSNETAPETTHPKPIPVVTVSKTRPTLRKRVLTMPDVCVPTYGGGGIGDPVYHSDSYGDKLPHTDRVSDAVKDKRTASPNTKYEDSHYKGYTNVTWDGFTIRHGFLYEEAMCHGGGAGVNMYEGAHLQNCIVIDNYAAGLRMKGGGIFCDGATSTIEGCFVLDNTSMRASHDNLTDYKQVFAGGLFLYEGTCFNSLFAKNYSFGSAGGVGFCVGRFFNNTIAYNTCDLEEGPKNSPTHKNGGAISIATESNPNLFIANTIIYGNTGMAIRERYDKDINNNAVNPFINCYVQTEVPFTQDIYKKNINNYSTSGNYGIGNTLLDGVAPSAANTPFAADLDDEGNYTGNAATLNDFRLTPNNDFCINTGTEDFAGSLKDVLKRKRNWSDAQVESQFIYRSVAAVELPINDVVYADRIQDCQIDIGAYEFDGTQEIKPGYELIAFDPERPDDRELCAVYYVNKAGGGLATGESYDNAACERKLQHILDAAGRLKYDLNAGTKVFSTKFVQVTGTVTATYEEIYLDGGVKKVRVVTVPDQNLADVKHVIVKVAEGTYYPIRSTNQKMVTGAAEEVLPTRSLMIPHGVEVMGGYIFDAEHPFYETYRDPLNRKTTFSGQVLDTKTGNYGRAYHVVTFTNDIFDSDNLLYSKAISASSTLSGENALADLTDRAVIDGISIEDGMANGTDTEEKGGGAAIVTSFAHVRNCILQDNEATFYGGALYMEPGALVSGCVMLNNEAEYGGAVYVKEPESSELSGLTDEARDPIYARLYNSTIVRNQASVRGGGVWYETNIRAKGVCLWWNRSNDMNNVAGVFDTQKLMTEGNYPFAYSAVQARRLPGVNNIELQADAIHGVRWTTNSIDDMRWRGDKPTYESETLKDAYYYIDRLSVLVRSGMPYQLYQSLRATFPSLEYRDMAGVARMKELYNYNDVAGTIQYLKTMTMTPENDLEAKDNSFLEMGARVLNYHASPRYERPFTRLFVSNPQNVDTEVASRLLNSADPLYSQQGSSMANPFQKLSDAFDYIVALRTSDNMATHGTTFVDADAFNAAKSVGPLFTRSGTEGAYTYTEADSWVSGTTYFRKYKHIFCDTRFEVFISGGTYYPYHNTYGVEGHARSSTFVIPEGVTVVGGIDPKKFYCQDGYNFPYLQPMAGQDILNYAGDEHPESGTGVVNYQSNARTTICDENGVISGLSDIELKSATASEIWEARKFADINGNNVYEPWEFLHLTTLSGNTPRGVETTDNVYHVITCFADPKYVGELPKRFANYDASNSSRICFSNELGAERGGTEDATSEMHRTIILTGLNITQGNARDYDSEAVSNLQQYYRGGGLLVDGSWTNGDGDSGQTDPDEKGKRNIPFYIYASQFQNNNAIQGGAIFTNGTMNIFSCSFVQNFAQGPTKNSSQSTDDISTAQGVVQYNGGGAIATNDVLRCVNTIFANNEAMLGDGVNMMSSSAPGYDKQGFGGAIWGGLNSEVRLMNCDIVMNKAVSYPSVFVNPAQIVTGVEDRFCINTIYWGNKTTGVTNSSFSGCGITDINDDVFSYRSQATKEIELGLEAKEADGTITDAQRTQLAALRENQPMFFCAYRPGFGPTPVTTTDKVTVPAVPRLGVAGGEYDPHEVPFLGESDIKYFDIFGGNNNINITFENEGVNGPNFVLPSTEPGKDGYNPSANWMPARINNLTDNGWSYMTLTSKTTTGDIEYKQLGANEYNQGGIPPETPGTPPDNNVFGGPFPFYAYQQSLYYNLTLMPFGNQHYMRYKNSNMTDAATNEEANMLRISSNPLTLEEAKAYIDLGVYEYQHRNLRINQSSEVDVLWVSAIENLDKGNDGYTWETPTSNLQAAIETLLKSRNNHAKQINIIGGEYKPTAVLGDNTDRSLSFTIQTRPYNNGAFTPHTDEEFAVRNLKFRGGYDLEIPEEAGYDFKKNKVTLSVEQRTSITQDQLNHVVNILDAEQYTTNVTPAGVVTSASRDVAIPITFEGITFNNTLADGIKDETDYKNPGGAAIYYHQQYQYDEDNHKKSETDLLKPPAQSREVTTTTTDPDTGAEIENVTWIWDWDTQHWQSSWTTEYREPKLTLRNCTFTQNGKEVADPTSAVLIEGGGGSSLIVNSVFDRNAGDPIKAVNTTVLNCTSGLNGGHIKLTETTENNVAYHSALYNNAIWRDDQNNSTPITESTPGTQFEVPTTAYNTSTSTPSERMSHNAITGFSHTEDAQKNYGLSDTNRDLFLGPNFEDPENGNFSIKPGKKLMNQGVNQTYARFVWPQPEYAAATEYEQLMQNLHPDQSQLITRSTTIRVGNDEKVVTYRIRKATDDHDAGFNDRLKNALIDRGAFECTSSGQRVIYVDPNKTSGTETGRTWEEAYGNGNLQMAIDAATIFASNGTEKAYVFVRGQRNSDTEDVVTFRDGVDVYGSIQPSALLQAVPKDPTAEELEYTESELAAFVNRVKAERRSVAARNVTDNMNYTTRIKGIASVDGSYSQGAVIDGFIITNEATDAAPATTPAVDITVPKVAVRNSIITGNVMDTGQSVVNLTGGSGTDENSLLYNTLIYGNTAGTIVNVGTNGYVLNCTVVADHTGETPFGGSGASTNVSNTIAANESAGMHATFAPYRRPDANVYTLPPYLTDHKPYWYQLHEQSKDINTGTDNKATNEVHGGNDIAMKFPDVVDFSHDRDLLGNPRRLGGQVDNGCFETWRIDDGDAVYTTNVTNAKAASDLNKYVTDLDSSDPSYASTFDDARMVAKGEYWTDNYGGHLYPHTGSVVYIGEGSVLSVDQAETTHTAPLTYPHAGGTSLFTSTNPVRPGYLLVQEGGSLHGNGNFVQAEYVATEHSFTAGEKQRLMAFPHDVRLEATISTSYDSGTNTLTQTDKSGTFTPYLYDADARAAWNYDFRADNSSLWKDDISPIQTANGVTQSQNPQVLRTEGWLLDFGTEGIDDDATYRFTGFGIPRSEGATDPYDPYAYSEGGHDAKTVTLTQHDNHPNDGTAHFTKLENMGWNLKGSPWLVSSYATGGTNPDYNMHVPHVFYRSLGNTYAQNTAHATYGQFYTEQSWDGSATLSPGDGFFTQTAAVGESEAVKFKVPYYGLETAAPVKELLTVCLSDEDGQGDLVAVEAPESADAASGPLSAPAMPYQINSDGIKWMALSSTVPQLWLENAGGTPFSLAAHAPREVPIPVGIRAEGDSELTFSLRSNQGADDFQAVWLIDQEAQRVVNLKEDSYRFRALGSQVAPGATRFFLQLDGQRPAMPDGTSQHYNVYVRNRVLHVTGTNPGDNIRVYRPDGALLVTGTADGNHWQTPLHIPGVYVVSIEAEAHKVMAK